MTWPVVSLESSAVVRFEVAEVVSATICDSEILLMTFVENAETCVDESAATLAVVSDWTSCEVSEETWAVVKAAIWSVDKPAICAVVNAAMFAFVKAETLKAIARFHPSPAVPTIF